VYNKAKNAYHSVCAHSAGASFYDAGIEVMDTCDDILDKRTDFSGRQGIYAGVTCPTGTNIAVTDCWGGKPFNDRQVGKYVRTYSIKDQSENVATIYRTFHNVDMTAPVIKLFGKSLETFEASRDVEYTDQGAKCIDYVDGDISHNVEVSGEIVNMKVPGTYHLRYDCQDNNGNMAIHKLRDIVIEDTECPYVSLIGKSQVFVEAGFPYSDAGATATDTLDGDISARVRTVGDTVDTAEAFYYAKSCAEIKKVAAKPPRDVKQGGHIIHASTVKVTDGQYYITTTTTVSGTKKTEAVVATCNFATGTTFFPLNAQRAAQNNKVVHLNPEDKYVARYPTCEEYGFVPFKNPTKGDEQFAKMIFPEYDLVVKAGVKTDMRLCTKAASDSFGSNLSDVQMPRLRAETGKYIIRYFVHDLADNGQCTSTFPVRTVVVEDTLPPVLTLTYKGKIINKRNDLSNPASHEIGLNKVQPGYGNPHYGLPQYGLMAETAANNGWIIAAVASAVAGVALMGYSAKKTTTQVPV